VLAPLVWSTLYLTPSQLLGFSIYISASRPQRKQKACVFTICGAKTRETTLYIVQLRQQMKQSKAFESINEAPITHISASYLFIAVLRDSLCKTTRISIWNTQKENVSRETFSFFTKNGSNTMLFLQNFALLEKKEVYALYFKKRRRERVDWGGMSGKVCKLALKHIFLCALRPLFLYHFLHTSLRFLVLLPFAFPFCSSSLYFSFAAPLCSFPLQLPFVLFQ